MPSDVDARAFPAVGRHIEPIAQRRGLGGGHGSFGSTIVIASSGIARQAFQFLSSLVLARLLTPSEFGKATVAVAIALFVQVFTDLGIVPAVVTRKDLTEEFLATAFWVNLVSGVALFLLTLAVRPLLLPLGVTAAMANLISLAVAGLAVSVYPVPLALLERGLRFPIIARNETVGAAIGILTGIACAAAGKGAASILIGTLATSLALSILHLLSAGWRPRRKPTRACFVVLYSAMVRLVGFESINYFSRNLDTLLLSITAGSGGVGLYARAYNLAVFPVTQVAGSTARALLPRMTPDGGNVKDRLRVWALSAGWVLRLGALVSLIFVFLSHSLVLFLFGGQWSASAKLLSVLGLSILPQLVLRMSGALFQSSGRLNTQLWVGAVNAVVIGVCMMIGLQWGVVGLTVAVTVGMYAAFAIMLRGVSVAFPRRHGDLLGYWWAPCVCYAFAVLVAVGVGEGAGIRSAVLALGSWFCASIVLDRPWRLALGRAAYSARSSLKRRGHSTGPRSDVGRRGHHRAS